MLRTHFSQSRRSEREDRDAEVAAARDVIRDATASQATCAEDQLLPGFVLHLHCLWWCGGATFCSKCGATAISDRLGRLHRECIGRVAQGSRGRLLRCLSGRLPHQYRDWPDGLYRADAIRPVWAITAWKGSLRASLDLEALAEAVQLAGEVGEGRSSAPSS